MRFYWPLCTLCALFPIACGDKSAVSLSAQIPAATLDVQENAFGASLSGSFTLVLALGPEAAGSTTVSLGNFSLRSAGGSALVDVLETQSQTTFPLVVAKDDSKAIFFTFSVDSANRAAICADSLRIVGSVMDTLKGGTDPVSSPLITPNCGAT